MATHYSILAEEIPWTEELRGATVHRVEGKLLFIGLRRVGHNLATKSTTIYDDGNTS